MQPNDKQINHGGIKMKILLVVNYYYPYISGLSEVVRLLAEDFAKQGHEVTVLCSNHDKLPAEEVINGVNVLRAPIICKISKGTVSLAFIRKAIKMQKDYDVVNLHLPMLEAGIISALGDKKKIVSMYHCDIDLAPGLINNMIKGIMLKMNTWGLKNSRKVLVTTVDYGKHSKIAYKFEDKMVEVHTPIKEYHRVEVERADQFKRIGFCGRIVSEKGIDVLLQAYKLVAEQRDDVKLVIGGDYQNIAGGSIFPQLQALIETENIKNVEFLGKIPEEKMAEFYSSLDVFCLPSINPLEAFGMVQIEAMLCGVPVVASDLYGVRTIVGNTGMGLVCKKGDAQSLADCIMKILDDPEKYTKSHQEIHDLYSTEWCVNAYLKCFKEVMDHAQ